MTTSGEPDQYLIERVREALAEDPRVGELYVQVTVAGGKVFLSGAVATPERKAAMSEVVAELLPDHQIHNLATISSLSEPEDEERLE
jgi:enamine deaminase RidA (YjgF/YER057c/UK114 family)